jgi:putative MATE family efflux protein
MKETSFVNVTFYAMLVPTIFMNLVTCVSSAADTIIVGNFLGEDALAAVTFSIPVYMIINTIASLLAVGGVTALGNALGRGEKAKADEIFSSSMIFALLISALMTVAGTAFIDPIVGILGAQQEKIAGLTRDYSIVVFYMTFAFIINISVAFFVRGDGRPTLAMWAMITSIIVNIALDIIFIAYMGMGIAGAAWATGISQAASALMMSAHFFTAKNTLRFIRKLPFENAALIFKSGAGTSLHFVYQFLTILFLNNLIMRISGEDGIVVFTVVINVSTIALSIFEGLSQTVQPMFSVYYGENDHGAINETMKLCARMTLILGLSVTVLLELFPYPLIKAFGVINPRLAADSASAIRIFSVSIVVMTFNAVMGYFYQSTERGTLAAVIVALRNFVMLLLGAVLFGHLLGINGIWCAYMFAEATTLAIWLAYAFYRGRRIGRGILLLPPEEKIYSFALSGELRENLLNDMKAFLDEARAGGDLSAAMTSAVREFTAYLKNEGGFKRAEIRIAAPDSDVISLIIRDDGQLLDQSLFAPASEAGTGHLNFIRQAATSFEYGAVLGVNRLLVKY